jgi:uncharacterized protein (DUF1697 family)
MEKLICLLRGVNMTGHNSIRMTELASLFNTLGFKDPVTYIQSGNVVISNSGKLNVNKIAGKIEKAILDEFHYKIPVLIRTPDELRAIINTNPFSAEYNFDPSKLAVLFLTDQPTELQIDKVRNINYPPDKFIICGMEIYIYCPNGFGKSKLYTNFFENKMKVIGTARNWKTVNTLLELADKKKSEES